VESEGGVLLTSARKRKCEDWSDVRLLTEYIVMKPGEWLCGMNAQKLQCSDIFIIFFTKDPELNPPLVRTMGI